jgi:hypothetical protein
LTETGINDAIGLQCIVSALEINRSILDVDLRGDSDLHMKIENLLERNRQLKKKKTSKHVA